MRFFSVFFFFQIGYDVSVGLRQNGAHRKHGVLTEVCGRVAPPMKCSNCTADLVSGLISSSKLQIK